MERNETAERVDLRRLLRVVVTNSWIVLALVVIAAGISYAWSSSQAKVYSSSAIVRVFDPDGAGAGATAAAADARVDPTREVAIEVLYARSAAITRAADAKLGPQAHLVRTVTVTGAIDTDTITIVVQSSHRTVARDAAQAYADVFVAQRQAAIGTLFSVQVGQVNASIANVNAQIALLDAKIAAEQPPTPVVVVGGSTIQLQESEALRNLDAQRAVLVGQVTQLRAQVADLDLARAARQSDIVVVEAASLPSHPIVPLPHRDAAVGGAIGLLLGLALVALRLRLRDKVTTSADVAATLPALSVIAAIPARWTSAIDRRRRRGPHFDVVDGRAPVREAYRALRASVLYGGPKGGSKSLLVTSASLGDGKTTIAVNLALSLARSGARVVVIDCDLRNPSLHDQFGIEDEVGLSSVLVSSTPIGEAVHQIDVAGTSIDVLPAGPTVFDPTDLLVRADLVDVVADLKKAYDHVVIDGPAMMPAADALPLARLADAVLVVVRSGQTKASALVDLDLRLRHVSTRVAAAVLVGVRADRLPPPGTLATPGTKWRVIAVGDTDGAEDGSGSANGNGSVEKGNVLVL